ncbi:HHL251Wp [Eremothecium sinecaudum]|uniref:HHL251Wp n=1 Tax=Eremothecium sinecaudum TaxID=45286 RepID=A0A0X8HW01_9SACH|nr:HHL251Wp [Eremothecium sinecaudum]AMD22519.1 HHL251Wp [Eremothecium sinecaudum]
MPLMDSSRNKGRHPRRDESSDHDHRAITVNCMDDINRQRISNSEVLLMDNDHLHDRPTDVGGVAPPSYYQVATPKSPHELSLTHDDDMHIHSDQATSQHPQRESEETERLKYEIAKSEIMEQLNLQILIKHKEMDELEDEARILGAQSKVLEILHDDKDLLTKVEEYQIREAAKQRIELERKKMLQDTVPLQYPTTAPAKSGGEYYYHTRSKSTNSHGTGVSTLRPANDNVMGLRMLGSKTIIDSTSSGSGSLNSMQTTDPFAPQFFNQHHRRNYSSTCISSNSGVIGRTDNGDAIFRRLDGLLIVITCCKCKKSGFTSAQGIVNHARLKHSTSYSSQPLAVLNNQCILPEEKQNKIVWDKFKELGLDPEKDYLPNALGKLPGVITGSNPSSTPSSSERRDNTPSEVLSSSLSPTSIHPNTEVWSTKHLEKMYGKKDFQEIVDYVNDAKKDLDVVLKIQSELEEGEDEEDDEDPNEESGSQHSPSALQQQPNTADREYNSDMKRKASAMDKEARERLRHSDKRMRPDALSMVDLPADEKRSSHYNLRAKSKLRSLSRIE